MAALLRLRLGLEEDCLFAAAWDGGLATAMQWIHDYLPEHYEHPDLVVDELISEWGSTRRAADRMVRRLAGAPPHLVAEAATVQKRQATHDAQAQVARACVAAGVSSDGCPALRGERLRGDHRPRRCGRAALHHIFRGPRTCTRLPSSCRTAAW